MKKVLIVVLAIVLVFAFATTALAAPYSWGSGNFALIENGSNNNYVRAAQNICKYNLPVSITVDGVFGSGTESAVRSYQSRYGLTVDGIVGSDTWSHMQSKLSSGTTGYFKIWQYGVGYTNTNFFRRQSYLSYRWDTYKAAPGSNPGTWYIVRY